MAKAPGPIPSFELWLLHRKQTGKHRLVKPYEGFLFIEKIGWIRIKTSERTRKITVNVCAVRAHGDMTKVYVPTSLRRLIASYQKWLLEAWPKHAQLGVTFDFKLEYTPQLDGVYPYAL